MKMGELVSSGCQSNARGLAKLAALMANKGSLDGEQLIKEETYASMMADPKEEIHSGLG